jgi:hypothetical protein
MTLADKPLARRDKIVVRLEKRDGCSFKDAEVVDLNEAMACVKVLMFFNSKPDRRGKMQWVKLADCLWTKPEPAK